MVVQQVTFSILPLQKSYSMPIGLDLQKRDMYVKGLFEYITYQVELISGGFFVMFTLCPISSFLLTEC